MRGLFLWVCALFSLFSTNQAQATEVTFRFSLGEEVVEINCSTNQVRIREMRALLASQGQEIERLRRLQQKKGLVEGENLLMLNLRFKVSGSHQNIAILEFGQHYCQNLNEIPSLEGLNLEEVLMREKD